MAGGALGGVSGFAWDKYDKHTIILHASMQGPYIPVFPNYISAGRRKNSPYDLSNELNDFCCCLILLRVAALFKCGYLQHFCKGE